LTSSPHCRNENYSENIGAFVFPPDCAENLRKIFIFLEDRPGNVAPHHAACFFVLTAPHRLAVADRSLLVWLLLFANQRLATAAVDPNWLLLLLTGGFCC
jgi:hypothetical protein